MKRSPYESWFPPGAKLDVVFCCVPKGMRRLVPYALFVLVAADVTLFTGCVSKKVGSTLAEAMVSQAIAPPIELSFSASKFRQATQRWPKDYKELSAFTKQSGDRVQPRQYDRVDFTEQADGSLEIYAVTVATGLTNRMTLTGKETDPK